MDGPLPGLGLDRPAPTELGLTSQNRPLMVTDGLIESRGIGLSVTWSSSAGPRPTSRCRP